MLARKNRVYKKRQENDGTFWAKVKNYTLISPQQQGNMKEESDNDNYRKQTEQEEIDGRLVCITLIASIT